jgi:sec-independent protein translocase protein TatC
MRLLPEARPPAGEPSEALTQMSLLQHLEELRKRLIHSLIGLVVAFGFCWAFIERIFGFLSRPVQALLPEGTKLAFLGLTDPFILFVKVALLAAVFLASPWLMVQAWRFIAPGLYRRERRWALPFVLAGTTFFVAGGAFAYYIAFPFAAEFLLGMGAQFDLQPVLTIERYIRFLMTVMLGMGLMFELPVLIFLLARMGLVTPGFLIRKFRWAVLIIFVIAALITPTPDVVNLCLFAVPTIGLYLLGVAAAALFPRRRERPAADETAEPTP